MFEITKQKVNGDGHLTCTTTFTFDFKSTTENHFHRSLCSIDYLVTHTHARPKQQNV